MANQTITETTITVHGRGSLDVPFKLKDQSGTQVDLSTYVLRFEVDGVPISTLLVTDGTDALGKRIRLTRTQVATLSKSPTRFAVIDETNLGSDMTTVLWSGTIARTDYAGSPDSVDG